MIALEIKRAIETSKIAIAADLWSDKFRNIHYLGMVAHYIVCDEGTKPNLVSRVLKLEEMEAAVPKTANAIHDHIFAVLNEFDLAENTGQIVFITDRGKNIVRACDGYARHSCLDHFINNVVCEMVKEIDAIRVAISKNANICCSYVH